MLRSLLTAVVAAASIVAAEDPSTIPFNEFARETNQSLLWNPYRPNVYFGVRPRIAKSFVGGLMWSKVDNFQDVQHSELLPLILVVAEGSFGRAVEAWIWLHMD